MAEKKFGDIGIGLLFGIFFLGAMASVIISFDDKLGNDNLSNLGSQLEGVHNNTSPGYMEMEQTLYQDTYNTSVFSIPTGSDVDPRGTSQVIETTRGSPSTIRTFINNVGNYIPLHWTIITLISSVVIFIAFILVVRFFRPGGA